MKHKMIITLLDECRIHLLYSLQRGKTPIEVISFGMTLHCI